MKEKNSKEMRVDLTNALEDSVFKLAVFDAAEAEGRKILEQEKTSLSAEGNTNEPTEKSMQNYKKLLQKKKTPSNWRSFKKGFSCVAMVVFLITVCFVCAMGTVSAFRLKVLNFLIQFNDEYTAFEIREDITSDQSGIAIINWANTYVPTYIPDGYEIEDLSIGENIKTIMFKNEKEENGFVCYMEMDSSSTLNIDTEGASQVDSISIHGEKGVLSIKEDIVSIVWEKDGHMFLIQSSVGQPEALKIVEGVKFVK